MFKKFTYLLISVLLLIVVVVFSTANAQVSERDPRYGHRMFSKATITLKLPTTAMDGTSLVNDYALKNVNLYISEVSISCNTTALLCNLIPSVILSSGSVGIPTSYTYLGIPAGATIHVRADACNVNGCSYLSDQLTAVNNIYSITLTKPTTKETFRTNAPPETPEIVITIQPE
jgi:predicted transglutaminase-like protease